MAQSKNVMHMRMQGKAIANIAVQSLAVK